MAAPTWFELIGGTATLSRPGMAKTQVAMRHLPGLVILVHGVNSDGEWYDAAEHGLCAGLNTRLALDRSLDPGARLRPARYVPELMPDGQLNRGVRGKTFIADDGFSPVIRFRWGYKAAGRDGTADSVDEAQHYAGRIYLNDLEAWGGGPFQNGTSALPYMWGLGVDDRVFWWLYANMFPIDGREVYACPPRAYFAHAAHRLTELLRLIRTKQPDCPVTVVSHSQGCMIALAAALMGEKDGAIADTYVLSNPPYALESVTVDQIANHASASAVGEFGGVTTTARKETFKNFLDVVRQRAGKGQALQDINRRLAFDDPATGETRFRLGPFPAHPLDPHRFPQPGVDRDNRGRVFLYCNPHDQVVGISPLQGIGWKGVSRQQMAEVGAEAVFHQRVWAQPGGTQDPPFQVGAPAWTSRHYRYRQDHHRPGKFWYPPSPTMKFSFSVNPSQSAIARIFTAFTAPLVWITSRVTGLDINAMPGKQWSVPINAPVLPEPVTPQATRYGRTGDFDEGKNPARDALSAKASDVGEASDDPYAASGLGDEATQRSLRYEHLARLRAAEARHEVRKDDVDDRREAIKRMLDENPNATDHSTILTNAMHSEKVLAYDVAVGWLNASKINAATLSELRIFANWMLIDEFELDKNLRNQFDEYRVKGFFDHHQIQRTYTPEHMQKHAPRIIDNRAQNIIGSLKL